MNKNNKYIAYLRWILITYIVLCLIIAGLNFGLAPNASPKVKHLIEFSWHFYENTFKTLMIIVASYLSMKVIKQNKHYEHRQRNLRGMIIAALVLHVVLPIITGVYDLYFFSMPMPFTNSGLQLLDHTSTFYQSHLPQWGLGTISVILVLFFIYSTVVYIGTYFFGRQLQCSTLCLFNGFIGEAFSPAFPFLKKKHPMGYLKYLRILFLIIGIFFTGYWIVRIFTGGSSIVLEQIEVFKYLLGELFVAMFLWVAFTGRGYCHYCPLGTTLSGIAKLGKQRIDTTETKCIGCNQCNQICPMSIDIKSKAEQGLPVTDSRCVGCGHCVDICPTRTLKYRTKYIK